MGYRNSIPTNVMIGESKVMLMKHRAELLAVNFLVKKMVVEREETKRTMDRLSRRERQELMRNSNKKGSVLYKAWEKLKKYTEDIWTGGYEIFKTNYETWNFKVQKEMEIGTWRKLKKISDEEMKTRIRKKYKREGWKQTFVYTDGSKKKEGQYTGAAVIWPEEECNANFTTPKELTVYSVEAIAVLEALVKVEEINITKYQGEKMQVFICSDSESVIKAVTNCDISVHKNPYVVQIRHKIDKLSKLGIEMLMVWTPAHVGVKENEEADRLAKEATEESTTNRKKYKVSGSDIKEEIVKKLRQDTEKEIMKEAEIKGQKYFREFFIKEKAIHGSPIGTT